jgi:hypothetical protein
MLWSHVNMAGINHDIHGNTLGRCTSPLQIAVRYLLLGIGLKSSPLLPDFHASLLSIIVIINILTSLRLPFSEDQYM